jgi:glycosyltransferase involved in cell wall biosynthesis
MSGLADARVKYIHLPEPTPLGEKRNIAVDAAAGPIIVQFDDDDYYAPHYIRTMTSYMADDGVDFVKLVSFFLYSKIHKQYGYWDLLKKDAPHFVWSGSSNIELIRIPPSEEQENVHLGFGFSYVFKKKVWEKGPFPPRPWGEDTPLINAAIGNGFKIHLLNDQVGLCLHIVHGSNCSTAFPQYVIPDSLITHFFPGLDAALL